MSVFVDSVLSLGDVLMAFLGLCLSHSKFCGRGGLFCNRMKRTMSIAQFGTARHRMCSLRRRVSWRVDCGRIRDHVGEWARAGLAWSMIVM